MLRQNHQKNNCPEKQNKTTKKDILYLQKDILCCLRRHTLFLLGFFRYCFITNFTNVFSWTVHNMKDFRKVCAYSVAMPQWSEQSSAASLQMEKPRMQRRGARTNGPQCTSAKPPRPVKPTASCTIPATTAMPLNCTHTSTCTQYANYNKHNETLMDKH